MSRILEGQWTQKLLKKLRQELPGAFIRKLSDPWTGGLPDFVVVHHGRTTWWEVKVQPNRLSALQLETMKMLSSAGAVIEVTKDGHCIWVKETIFPDRFMNVSYDGLIAYIIQKTKGEL